MKLTAQNNPEWYRKCSKIRSGGRFLNLSVSKNLREDIFLQKLTFLKRIIQNRFDNPGSIWSIESI